MQFIFQVFKIPTSRTSPAQKRSCARKKEEDFLSTCTQVLKTITNPTRNLDEYDGIAINWAGKLRKLDADQQVLAEDLINQVLKKAYFKELTRSSVVEDNVYIPYSTSGSSQASTYHEDLEQVDEFDGTQQYTSLS